MLTQRRKDLRHFIKLRPCDVVTTSALLCYNVVTKSLFNVTTVLASDVEKTFISDNPSPNIVTTS